MNLARNQEEFKERWSSLYQLDRLRDEINRHVAPSSDEWTRRSELLEGWGPPVEFYEEDKSITVKFDLPGFDKEDIEISIYGGTLNISGERKNAERKEKEGCRPQWSYGRFYRSIQLSWPVDLSKAIATYREGILAVRLPKIATAQTKANRDQDNQPILFATGGENHARQEAS
jgi:HSP20 family molecular chaperone IbpA